MSEVEATISSDRAEAFTDDELVRAVESNVYEAGWHKQHSVYDANCSVLYREAVRRGNEALYEKGYRLAAAGLT